MMPSTVNKFSLDAFTESDGFTIWAKNDGMEIPLLEECERLYRCPSNFKRAATKVERNDLDYCFIGQDN